MVDDLDLLAEPGGQFERGFRLKGDESVSEFERCFCAVIRVDVGVDVCTCERKNQGTPGVCFAESLYAVVTPTCVESDQDVGVAARPVLADAHTVTEASEDTGPAERRDAITAA